MSTLEAVHSDLRAQGLLAPAHGLQIEIDKLRRRLRALCREDAGVALALQDRKRQADAQEQLVVRRTEEAYKMDLTAKRIKAEVHAAD